MRRFLAFVVLFACSLPVGLSIAGCGHNPNNYCIKNGNAYGITTSQVVYVTMGPEVTGLSLAWGQTGNLGAPQAYNCNGGTASVSRYTYASSNLLLADVSPSGTICAGTWNRNSPGGTADFTICTPPSGSSLSSFAGCSTATCGTVQITATGAAVTSNPVNIYVHPPITSITIPSQTACVSQGQTLSNTAGQTEPLLAETTVTGPGGVTLCSPSTISCTSTSANVGTIAYIPATASVVTINNTTAVTNPPNPVTGTPSTPAPNPNGIATANLPGSTVVNATTSETTSAAGFFSTCPPASIKLSVNGSTTATVTPSSPQTVVAAVTDTNGATITGLPLTYSSTEPQNLSVSSIGLVTATFPSHATVTAICQPPTCNPAPVNLIGNLGNGMPVSGNRVNINSPGRSSNQIWMASTQSPYFSEVDLSTGGAAAPVRLPYTPNSMVMDQGGDTLFFGSYHELMTVSTLNNSLSKEVTGVPGVVLAVSPTGSTAVINDQLRQVIYLYSVSAGTFTSIGGVAFRAQYAPDGATVYISGIDPATGQNTLFVNGANTGWSQYPLTNEPAYACQLEAAGTATVPAYNPSWDPYCGPALTITVPSVAAFLAGNSTAARSYCPNTNSNPPYYPPAGDVGATTTQLTATADGNHILGAAPTSFSDILLGATPGTAPAGVPTGACPSFTGPPLTVAANPITATLPVAATEIDQVVSSPDSSVAFVTYTASAATGVLPYYQPLNTGAMGALGTMQLSSGAQAPIVGIFSPDGTIFFTGTSGDDLVHLVNTTTLTDTQTIDPKLTNGNGVAVPAQFLAVKSRSTT
jgi:trimeric autotransporter adhesin